MKPRRAGPSIAYGGKDNLYLNVTNRCSNDCTFCVRGEDYLLWGYDLRLSREPSLDEVLAAVAEAPDADEIVFCGMGEPAFCADLVIEAGRRFRPMGKRVRLNTNGHADRICGRDIVPELTGAVDAVSVSLNAQDEATYNRICRPKVPDAYAAVLSFLERAVHAIGDVTASVVRVGGVNIDACEEIARGFGARFRVRG